MAFEIVKTATTGKVKRTIESNNTIESTKKKAYDKFSFLKDYNSYKNTSKEIFLSPNLEIVTRVNTNGNVKFCNAAHTLTTGYNENEILHNKTSITMHPEMPKVIFNYIITALNKRNEAIAIIRHLDKDGNSYWLNTHFTPNKGKKLSLAYSSKAYPSSKKTIKKFRKIYSTLFLLENHVNENTALKYFEGLLEMEYGNYNGFTMSAFE